MRQDIGCCESIFGVRVHHSREQGLQRSGHGAGKRKPGQDNLLQDRLETTNERKSASGNTKESDPKRPDIHLRTAVRNSFDDFRGGVMHASTEFLDWSVVTLSGKAPITQEDGSVLLQEAVFQLDVSVNKSV